LKVFLLFGTFLCFLLMLGVDQSGNSIMFWVMKEAPTFNQTTLMALQHSLATALWLKLYIDTEKRNIANA